MTQTKKIVIKSQKNLAKNIKMTPKVRRRCYQIFFFVYFIYLKNLGKSEVDKNLIIMTQKIRKDIFFPFYDT